MGLKACLKKQRRWSISWSKINSKNITNYLDKKNNKKDDDSGPIRPRINDTDIDTLIGGNVRLIRDLG